MSLSLFLRRHHSAHRFWVQIYRKKFNFAIIQTHCPLKKDTLYPQNLQIVYFETDFRTEIVIKLG